MSDKLKNFIVRTLSGAVLLLVILGAMWVGFLGYLALLFFITVLGVREFYSLAKAKGYEPQRGLGLTLAIMIYLVGAFAGISFEYQVSEFLLLAVYPVILIVPLIGLIFFVEVFRNRTTPIANVATTLAGVIYVAFPMALMPGLALMLTPNGQQWSALYFLFYLFLVWGNDVFAYLAGVTMGRHKMCERLSPKKSWEGFAGGVLGSLAVGALAAYLLEQSYGIWIGLALIVSLTSVVGDLVESMFKRDAGVKDSGSIMPGHGGILDRFDAFILAAPFAFIYMLLVVLDNI